MPRRASAGESTGVAPLVTTCVGPLDGRRGVHRQDLADDEPVAEHADGRQVLLDGGRRPGVGPDVGRHVQRRDRREPQAPRRAPRQKLPHGPPVRRARAPVRDPRGENSRNFSTATGPASTISRGSTSAARGASAVRAGCPSARPARRRRSFPHRSPAAGQVSPRRPTPRSARSRGSAPGRARRAARRRPGAAEAHLDPAGRDRHAGGQAGQARLERRDWARPPGSW